MLVTLSGIVIAVRVVRPKKRLSANGHDRHSVNGDRMTTFPPGPV